VLSDSSVRLKASGELDIRREPPRRRTSYSALIDRLRIGRSVPSMELHFIADDLEEHAWYVDLVADFIDDVEAFLGELEEASS
jgi:nitrate/nitrite-specific signal transduction histidine kinase